MWLQITELCELLVAIVKLASEWFRRGMDDFMRTDIPVLSKCFATDVALIWSFTSMPPFVGFEVTQLAESLTAGWFFA
jgi:uncharacterized protein (UPF0261 family)